MIGYSSEIMDHELGLVYYNYRHLNPLDGRWISRDFIFYYGSYGSYNYINNRTQNNIDILGLFFKEKNIYVNATSDDYFSEIIPSMAGDSFQTLIDYIDKQLGMCDCVKKLTLIIHGDENSMIINHNNDPLFPTPPCMKDMEDGLPADGIPIAQNPNDPNDANIVDDNNASSLFGALSSQVSFCKNCIIYLLSCNTGLRQNSFVQQLSNSTGCTVYAPKGFCAPNVANPLMSGVSKEENSPCSYSPNNFSKYKPKP